MVYSLLRRMNPGDADLTAASSAWLASRVPVGVGANGVSLPQQRVVNDAAMRTCEHWPFENRDGARSLEPDGNIGNRSTMTGLLWVGLWVANGVERVPVIGESRVFMGMVCPLDAYNVGYRYRPGWRPQRVN